MFEKQLEQLSHTFRNEIGTKILHQNLAFVLDVANLLLHIMSTFNY